MYNVLKVSYIKWTPSIPLPCQMPQHFISLNKETKTKTTLLMILVSLTLWSYTVVSLFIENVKDYQAESFMFYNIQISSSTFMSEYRSQEQETITLCNSK